LQMEAQRSERLLAEQQAQAESLLSELQAKKQLVESLQEQIAFVQLENKELQERVAANAENPTKVKSLVEDYELQVTLRAEDRSMVASLEARAKQAEDELEKCRSEQARLLSSLEERTKHFENELLKCRSEHAQSLSSLEARAEHAENELHKSRSEQAQLLASLEAQSKHAEDELHKSRSEQSRLLASLESQSKYDEDELHKSRSEQARLLASLEAQSKYAEEELRKSRSEQTALQQELRQAKKALFNAESAESVHLEKILAASARITELESALRSYVTLDSDARTAELAWKLGGETFEAWVRSSCPSPRDSVASRSSVYSK